MLKAEHILSYLKEKKEDFFSEYQLTKIGLFGSFARQHESEDSDIDILVEFVILVQFNLKRLIQEHTEIFLHRT